MGQEEMTTGEASLAGRTLGRRPAPALRWLPAAAASIGGLLAVLPAARSGCWLAVDVMGLAWGLESLVALPVALALTGAAAAASALLVHGLGKLAR